MHFSKLNDCLFDISYLTLAFEVAKINSDVVVVKIQMYAYEKLLNLNQMKWQDYFYIFTNRFFSKIGS